MKYLVVCSLLVLGSTWALPQGYIGGGNSLGAGKCGAGEVRNVDGNCAKYIVTRNIFVYAAPEQPRPIPGPVNIPNPKVNVDIVFVRAPEQGPAQDPIILPPPQTRTMVYVLQKKPQGGGQKIIEVPAPPPSNPEVYFVNYGPGENPQLPGGVDLQAALGAAGGAGGGGGGIALGGLGGGLGGGDGGFGGVLDLGGGGGGGGGIVLDGIALGGAGGGGGGIVLDGIALGGAGGGGGGGVPLPGGGYA